MLLLQINSKIMQLNIKLLTTAVNMSAITAYLFLMELKLVGLLTPI